MSTPEFNRAERKRFQTTIKDLSGTAQNPDADTCVLYLKKQGGEARTYDNPRGPFPCSQVGGVGVFGADVWIPETITLGNWIAEFQWKTLGKENRGHFTFIIVDSQQPYKDNPYGAVCN